MVNGIKRQMGLTLMLTGFLHTIVGLILFFKQLLPMISEGLWNTVRHGEWERGTAFWFIMFGFVLIVLGYLADWIMKKAGIPAPSIFGWMLLAICLIGVIVMPVSGFWLGLPQALILLLK
ncbi:DUF6463 family protein [Paenibacillus hexagrammi]|uniref:DUF6463 family protein n=1 Tax=Paenibacillus hexagrammi TaxID=2908839 RepID=A0ABY3SNR2_9BACL|nr:DUF6463 family protein [Paenibacillus sp. YPD9-1]UJF35568.1 DUF6463 family protein [Paenibacillus sp. YPD9-1]